MIKIAKRFAAAATVVAVSVFTAAALASCDLDMEKESGYTEGRYELTAFSESESSLDSIVIEADGGLNLTLCYGEDYGVSYTESDQEKFTFSFQSGVLNVFLTRSVKLFDSRGKDLVVTLPLSCAPVSLTAKVDGALFCKMSGAYASLDFDVDGAFDAELSGTASQFAADVDGVANIKDKTFAADYVRLDVDGALNVELTCNLVLSLDVDGACSGKYYGDCRVEKSIDGIDGLTAGASDEEE